MPDEPAPRASQRVTPDGPAASGSPARPGSADGAARPVRSDRSPLNWLLLLPLLVTLVPPLYNRIDPEVGGIPFFYWYQLAVISVGVVCTYLVYRNARR